MSEMGTWKARSPSLHNCTMPSNTWQIRTMHCAKATSNFPSSQKVGYKISILEDMVGGPIERMSDPMSRKGRSDCSA